jgi:hypothetical protein
MMTFDAALALADAALPLPAIPTLLDPLQMLQDGPTGAGATDDTADDGDASGERRVNMRTVHANKRWTHVRVPVALAGRLDTLARKMERDYAEGRVSLPGEMADRVPVWFVIAAALDEQEARRERSRRPRKRSV